MSKAFAKLAERFAEMTGDKDVTAISETFEQNAKGVESVESATKELLGGFAALLQPNPTARAKFTGPSGVASRLTGGTTPSKYPQHETTLATVLEKHSTNMESYIDNSTFALTLKDSSETFRRIGEAREDLDYSVKQNVFEPWMSLQTNQIKEVKDQRTKMEGRRLYYDNLRKKYQRNPEKVNQMDVEQAKDKLEITLRQADASMDAILCSDIDRVAQLKHLIDAQQEYHKKTSVLLEELSTTLTKRINEATPRNGTKPQATLKPPTHTSSWGDFNTGTSPFQSSTYEAPSNSITTPSQPAISNGPKTGNLLGDAFDPWNEAGCGSGRNSRGAQYALPPASSSSGDPFNVYDTPGSAAGTNQGFGTIFSGQPAGGKKRVKLLYQFDSQNPGELDLKSGDIVENVESLDDHWYQGEIKRNGTTKSGYFPKSYAEFM